ncbi:MAG: Gfo/Idh/MocA family oxidoreductase [Planctomycetota bacterium]|nr:Gfo/Idh/MocA family oxidoreductase [Planctomycetota bacterium]
MSKYTVAQVGVGHRGKIHANAFLQLSDHYQLVGLCDLLPDKLEEYVTDRNLSDDICYDSAEKMLAETMPDVFCFCTLPETRLELVELAAKYHVKGLAFEKPMATSISEAHAIREICREHGMKTVVSHQHKYLTSHRRMKQTVDGGEIGEVDRIEATCRAHLSQLGTHYIDYIIWANGGHKARWVIGHVHGPKNLEDSHPSPDYMFGHLLFENGIRASLECGYLSPMHMPKQAFWVDNRLTMYGTHGYAWADTDGRFAAVTRTSNGEVISENGPGYDPDKPGSGWSTQQSTTLQPAYLRELADWLDDDSQVHPCNVDLAYHGYEILEGVCISALEKRRVDLPLDPSQFGDINERMRNELPEIEITG